MERDRKADELTAEREGKAERLAKELMWFKWEMRGYMLFLVLAYLTNR